MKRSFEEKNYSDKSGSISFPSHGSDGVKIWNLFYLRFIPGSFPWTPVEHSQSVIASNHNRLSTGATDRYSKLFFIIIPGVVKVL